MKNKKEVNNIYRLNVGVENIFYTKEQLETKLLNVMINEMNRKNETSLRYAIAADICDLDNNFNSVVSELAELFIGGSVDIYKGE